MTQLHKAGRTVPGEPRHQPLLRLLAAWPEASSCLVVFVLLLFTLHLSPFTLRVRADAPRPQPRVVSQTVGNDELLYAVADPGQIACLSHLSRDSSFSAIAGAAAAFPSLQKNATAETILSYEPTLVIFNDYSRTELVEQVRRAGVRVIVITKYYTLDDAFDNLRMIARELGPRAEARAEAIIADGLRRVAALRETLKGAKPVRVIAPSTYGLIPGSQSTFQDLCDYAGAENLAFTLGRLKGHQAPPSEKMLTWPIDKAVLVGADKNAALAPFKKLPPYQYMSAIREGRVVLLEPWQISCVSHLRIDAYERLARELHSARFPLMNNGK
ncbi:ABC transporter substrate-binding protein [Ereboglobus luteus]|uniref:Fe/B12 periplasmic-binding domain-containing protein n=1 Tax=Ereboglobus luteus TaxID=1796921 RepID=A0A2U8E304_9BACT|nr:ABC transporter substrate-binding protein [Ereboglobus luteus]AWI09201.1 hypothetical protein CKA38_08085 [Ereboglobus luteus]